MLADATETVLICWDHERIPAIAAALPTAPGTQIPDWPDHRFDMIWSLTRQDTAEYEFSQLPQLLLAGDSDSLF